MAFDMSKNEILGLLQAIAEGITAGIKNYREAQGCCAAAPAAAPCACNEKPAVEAAKPEKKEEAMTVLQMAAKVLKKSPTPLGKDDIIKQAKERFGVDINKTTLSVSLNQALKKHKAVKRVSHGRYTNIGRKIEIQEAPKAAEPAAPVAPAAPAAPVAPAAPAEPAAPVVPAVPAVPQAPATEA